MRIKEYATEEILKKSKNQYVFIFGAGNNTKKFLKSSNPLNLKIELKLY